jgi:hypothetical protein
MGTTMTKRVQVTDMQFDYLESALSSSIRASKHKQVYIYLMESMATSLWMVLWASAGQKINEALNEEL